VTRQCILHTIRTADPGSDAMLSAIVLATQLDLLWREDMLGEQVDRVLAEREEDALAEQARVLPQRRARKRAA